jgi:hypothetical protein
MGLYLDGAIVTLPLLGTFAAVEGRFVACWDANAFVFAQSIRQLARVLSLAVSSAVAVQAVAHITSREV